jgi:hypothetical protein
MIMIEERDHYVKASPTLIAFLAKNIFPDHFARNVALRNGEIGDTDDGGMDGGGNVSNLPMSIVVRSMEDYPVYNEESEIPEVIPKDYTHKRLPSKTPIKKNK